MNNKKFLSVLTVVILSVQMAVWAAPIAALNPVSDSFSPIKIPSELGEVESSFQAPEGKNLIVHIRDAHGSYEAQKNIKAILDELVHSYGFELLCLEGADGDLDPSGFRFFTDANLNSKVADILMRHGELTGSEMFLLEGKSLVKAHGVENAELYRKNFKLFRNVLDVNETSSDFLGRLKTKLSVAETRIFSKELRNIAREWRKFKSSDSDTLRFLNLLHKTCLTTLKIDLKSTKHQDTYGDVLRILRLADIEHNLDIKKAQKEKDELLVVLRDLINPNLLRQFSELFEDVKIDSKKKNKIFPRFILEQVIASAQPQGVDSGHFPAFMEYARYLIFQSEIDSKRLYAEVDALTRHLFEVLAKTEEEKSLLTAIEDISLLEKLFSLELSSREYETLINRQAELKPSELIKRISTYSGFTLELEHVIEMDSAFREALEFYRVAKEREESLLTNSIKFMKKNGKSRFILVTGGFHSEGIENALKEKGVSFISVNPQISNVGDSNEIYRNAMLGKTDIRDRAHLVKALKMAKAGLIGRDDSAVISDAAITVLERELGLSAPDAELFAKRIRAGERNLMIPAPRKLVTKSQTSASSLGLYEEAKNLIMAEKTSGQIQEKIRNAGKELRGPMQDLVAITEFLLKKFSREEVSAFVQQLETAKTEEIWEEYFKIVLMRSGSGLEDLEEGEFEQARDFFAQIPDLFNHYAEIESQKRADFKLFTRRLFLTICAIWPKEKKYGSRVETKRFKLDVRATLSLRSSPDVIVIERNIENGNLTFTRKAGGSSGEDIWIFSISADETTVKAGSRHLAHNTKSGNRGYDVLGTFTFKGENPIVDIGAEPQSRKLHVIVTREFFDSYMYEAEKIHMVPRPNELGFTFVREDDAETIATLELALGSPAAKASSLGLQIPPAVLKYLVDQGRSPYGEIALTRLVGGVRFMPGRRDLLRLAMEEADIARVSPVAQAFNGDAGLQHFKKHLALPDQAPQNPLPLFLFKGYLPDVPKSELGSLAGKIAAIAAPGDLLVHVGEHPVIHRLHPLANRGGFRLRTVPRELISAPLVADLSKSFELDPVLVSQLKDTSDLILDLRGGTRVKIDRDLMDRLGIDTVQVLALIRQIAENPSRLEELFTQAGFTPRKGFWEVGNSFVSLLEELYKENIRQKTVASMA